MTEYIVKWSETSDYSKIVEADSEEEAWRTAYENSTFTDIQQVQLDERSVEIEEA